MSIKNKRAFTLVEILIVVAIIGLLSAVGIPSFLNSRQNAEDKMKKFNVSTVNAAKDQWAILNNITPDSIVVWTDIEDYVGVKDEDDLKVNGVPININNVGKTAAY